MKRDLRQLFRMARARGWVIERTRSDHWKLLHPPTGAIVFTGSTPSCPRAVRNAEAPTRLRLLRRAGWRLPPGAVSVAYPTRWANPYRPAERSAAANAEAVRLYRVWLAERMAADPAFLEPLRQATGLACFCPLDLPCHADVLIELLEGSHS